MTSKEAKQRFEYLKKECEISKDCEKCYYRKKDECIYCKAIEAFEKQIAEEKLIEEFKDIGPF